MKCPLCNHKIQHSLYEKLCVVIIILVGILTASCLGHFIYTQEMDRLEYKQGIKDVLELGKQEWINKGYGVPIKKGGK